MSGHILGNKVPSRTSKSLYTVLYDHVSELSASSTGETEPCSIYLKRLTREHLARASMEEIGPSVTFSPKSEARVAQWTEKVKQAFAEANGNAADGRWTLVSDLLQLHCTRGGSRWLGINLDLQAPEIPKQLCHIPETNEEWEELERRIKAEEDVNSKVQRWIRSAEFVPLSPGTAVNQGQDLQGTTSLLPSISEPRERLLDPNPSTKVTQTSLKNGFFASHPLSSGSKFGFNVVKRPNVFIKDTYKSRNSLSSAPPPDQNPPLTSLNLEIRSLHNGHEPSDETGHPSSSIVNVSSDSISSPPFDMPDYLSRARIHSHSRILKSRLLHRYRIFRIIFRIQTCLANPHLWLRNLLVFPIKLVMKMIWHLIASGSDLGRSSYL